MAEIKINLDSLKPKREWKRHKVQPGHNIFRVLPPFGDSSNGYPYRKWMITWGLVDPESGRMRPFASSLTTEKRCPIAEYVDALVKKAEGLKASLKASGVSDAEIKEQLKNLNKVISNVRPKTVYAYNAINKAGEVGLLEIKSTAQKKLKELMMEYISDYNQDPTSLNSEDSDSGVWFDFVRQGEGFDTEYDVKKVQNKVRGADGRTSFVDDRSPLPENVSANYKNMAYDLGAIYQVKKYDELKAILLANLRAIVQDVPEALVPGFDNFDDAPEVNADQGLPSNASRAKTTAPAGKTSVALNLADDEDEAQVETKQATKPAATTTKTTLAAPATIDDDVFAMADDILGS